jgi:hypothetical protein
MIMKLKFLADYTEISHVYNNTSCKGAIITAIYKRYKHVYDSYFLSMLEVELYDFMY